LCIISSHYALAAINVSPNDQISCSAFDGYFTDYIRVLNFLIDTPKDVDLLVQKRILVNGLGDSNALSTLVNNL